MIDDRLLIRVSVCGRFVLRVEGGFEQMMICLPGGRRIELGENLFLGV